MLDSYDSSFRNIAEGEVGGWPPSSRVAAEDPFAAGTPSPMTYQTPKPQEVMDEDKVIEAYPLGIKREQITIVPVDQMFAK